MLEPADRKRSRVACTSCQTRKRKCSGEQPCSACSQFGYGCYYDFVSRKRKDVRPANGIGGVGTGPAYNNGSNDSNGSSNNNNSSSSSVNALHGESLFKKPGALHQGRESTSSGDSNAHLSSLLEANSGATFVRKLGLKLDHGHAPRLHMFAWNVGSRQPPQSTSSMAGAGAADSGTTTKKLVVVDIITQAEMRSLAAVYFQKIHPFYGFVDKDFFLQHVERRWQNKNGTSPMSPSNAASSPSPSSSSHSSSSSSSSSSASIASETEPYDSVLCGVAACGYLFSRRKAPPAEHDLVECARLILERDLLSESTSIAIVTGWALRTAYLRMTASPQTAWMASCSLMHMIEAARLHLEPLSEEDIEQQQQHQQPPHRSIGAREHAAAETRNPEIWRRLFGMARHLNIWLSFDLGRSPVFLPSATSLPPSPRPGDYTTDLLHLLPLSDSLDPNQTRDSPPDLETALANVLDVVHVQPPLLLAQCNLALCIYRRLRAVGSSYPRHYHRQRQLQQLQHQQSQLQQQLPHSHNHNHNHNHSHNRIHSDHHHNSHSNNNHNIPARLLDQLLDLAVRALRAAREMLAAGSPWHHLANVPFQVICTLLAIDTSPALAILADAMQTLRQVTAAYDSLVTKEAYTTAYLLILLHQRRKEDDCRTLAAVLCANASASAAAVLPEPTPAPAATAAAPPAPAPAVPGLPLSSSSAAEEPPALAFTLEPAATGIDWSQHATSAAALDSSEFSWLGDLVIDLPSLQNFDLEQFLTMDIPWPLPETGI